MQPRLLVLSKQNSVYAHPDYHCLSTLVSFLLNEVKILKIITREGIKLTSLAEVTTIGRCIYKESNQFAELFLQNAIERRNTKKYRRLCEIFKLRHANIASYYGLVKDERSIAGFLMEAVSPKTLDYYVSQEDCDSLSEIDHEQIVNYSIQLARTLAYCHEMKVVHGDVQPANILLTKDETTLKLSNFNFELNPDPTLTVTYSRQDYSAPEVILGTKYSPASDVYSFGMVLYSLLHQQRPFHGSSKSMNNPLLFRQHLESGERPEFKDKKYIAPELREIIEECWRTTADKRPTMKEVLQRLCRIRDGQSPMEEELDDWDILDKMDCVEIC